jgi:DNA replication initiation complex subunit (GINS family)
MDLQKGYDRLYQHWLNEFQNTDLTELSQELFENYKNFLLFINNYQEEGKDEIKDIFESYKDNLNYLFDDFLKMRELKIINSALALKEIKLDNILETEKLLYENLVSSLKGYRKVKAFSLYEEKAPFDKSIELRAEIKSSVEEIPISKEEQDLLISDSTKKADQEQIDYTLVRFLKSTPPLVGVDLISYGPFEKEDIANLPQKNAKILIIEKFAEKIEIQ